MEAIGDFYSELRGASTDNALPVTVRTLETIIRLSTAAAKARLAPGMLLTISIPFCSYHPLQGSTLDCVGANSGEQSSGCSILPWQVT